ncbi:MAG: hypothetical protein JSR73_14315 [Proteobacteria bacterium]|nr:hypothetical protein [Pseudomonadota bacterium]
MTSASSGRGRRATRRLLGWLLAASLLAGWPAGAALEDEIQVYLDDLDAPGEWGLEVHLNTTPSGVTTPSYPGEVVSARGTRLTQELSYGLGNGFEAGLYLPAVVEPGGHPNLAGAKLRLKWLPIAGGAQHDGWFAGANLELARVPERYEQTRWGSELRLMAGRRVAGWTLGMNPVFAWALGEGGHATPDFELGLKAARDVARGIALGAEYYAGLGPVDAIPGWAGQDHRLYATLDVDRAPWVFNFGVGYGLSAAADRWTVKLIIEVPLRSASKR